MDVTVIAAFMATIISVVGWFVVSNQGKKARKEEAQRELYYKLVEMTLQIFTELDSYYVTVDKMSGELEQLFIKSNDSNDKKKIIDDWYEKVSIMINNTFHRCSSIDYYLKYLEMGGSDINGDSPIFYGLKSVSFDTKRSLYAISGRWINYINFSNMSDNQLRHLVEETRNDLKCLFEFCGCLDDILVYLYNRYMIKPLGLKKRSVAFEEKRRYVTDNGLVDKRAS